MKKAEKDKLERIFNSHFKEIYNIYVVGNFIGLISLSFKLGF